MAQSQRTKSDAARCINMKITVDESLAVNQGKLVMHVCFMVVVVQRRYSALDEGLNV